MTGLTNLLKESMKWKFETLKRRSIAVINQLTEKDIIWHPGENGNNNSIANIVSHIWGTIHQRVEIIFLDVRDIRDRDKEFETGLVYSKNDTLQLIERSFDLLNEILESFDTDDFMKQPFQNIEVTNSALNKNSTVLDIYMQMMSHLSEHAGQIIYIAKLRLGDNYVTTTIPKNK
jgi:hypothetical protein